MSRDESNGRMRNGGTRSTDWHAMDAGSAIARLGSDAQNGIATAEAEQRLREYGPNELVERSQRSPWRILWEQLSATLVVVLIVAGIVSAFLGDVKDAVAILAIVILNALLGFRQEYRAEKAMAALKRLAVPKVKVRREGHLQEISAQQLVPGDVVLLEAGSAIPADGRLLEAANLRVQEAPLTGESHSVEKDVEGLLPEDQPLAERSNMAYMGTSVSYGRGRLLVVATGMSTELGHIASMLQTVPHEVTPLQLRLNKLGRVLAGAALGIVALIFALGMFRAEDVRLLFMTAVSLAVAAVPEGLPAVVTIALALGAQRMLRREALIRKLPAVETLGGVTTICSDKTGTLTKNEMEVAIIDVAGERMEVGAAAAELDRSATDDSVTLLLVAGGLCNDAVVEPASEGGLQESRVVGEPTEAALVAAANRFGIDKSRLEEELPRVDEVPFDSERKRMSTVHDCGRGDRSERLLDALAPVLPADRRCQLVFTKGALDSLLRAISGVWSNGQREPFDDWWKERIQSAHDELAEHGMRVLGVGFRVLEGTNLPADRTGTGPMAVDLERDLTFLGLVGIIDPPRVEAKQAVDVCKRAGIRPIMITGDHPLTARYIAGELGFDTGGGVVTGKALDEMSADRLLESITESSVYARVTPEHKLRLVEALQERGEVVAMTGDGVNDAPALKRADIGVAMGITGTDVSKEASDMILQDDNFATIVAAVEQGRIIFDNIRKFIRYLLSANVGELWVMLLGPLLGMPMPLWPLQILWMNLVTDGFPALALGVEPAERNAMRRPPYPPGESVFARGIGVDILWIGIFMGFLSLGVGYYYWASGLESWRTMLFSTLTFSQMTLALAVRSDRDSLFQIGLMSNKPMLAAVGLTFLLQLGVIYLPVFQPVFRTVPLSIGDLLVALLLSTVVFGAVELRKLLTRIRSSSEGRVT